jgi:hypothetical protein
MIFRWAYAYIRLLFVLEMLLFAASLLLHLSVFIMGPNEAYAKYGLVLFRGSVVVGIPITPFVKDNLKCKDQIKSCPKWMWKGCLILGVYGLLLVCLQMIFPQGSSFSDQILMVSGSPLALDAIALCVIYSVLWSGYLEKSEVVRRATHSVAFVTLGVVVFLAYRAGYLYHFPRNN